MFWFLVPPILQGFPAGFRFCSKFHTEEPQILGDIQNFVAWATWLLHYYSLVWEEKYSLNMNFIPSLFQSNNLSQVY